MKTPTRYGDAPRAEPYLQLGGAAPVWPAQVGARFAALLDLFDGPVEAAEIAEITTDQLALFARGRAAPPFSVVARLADAAGVDLNWLWSGDGEMMRPEPEPEPEAEPVIEPEPVPDIVPADSAPALGADYLVPASDLALSGRDDWPQLSDALAFRTPWLAERLRTDPEGLLLFTVAGDEMAPTLRAGDLALCDRAEAALDRGGLYAFSTDDRIVVRRVQCRFDGSVLLISDDPHYETEALHPQDAARLRILGRVVWHGRSL